jgi:predicted RNA-binding protein with TRAM domain
MSYSSRTRYGGSSSYANRSFGSKPVETGKEYNVQITETSRKGDGIAKVQGFVIFVKGAQIGQDVKAKIISVGERFATAEIAV